MIVWLRTVLEFSDTIEQSNWERQYEQHPAPLHIQARQTASLFHRIVSRRVSRNHMSVKALVGVPAGSQLAVCDKDFFFLSILRRNTLFPLFPKAKSPYPPCM
ncbi:hypothetical protein VNO77_23372 [Canavalia gladiata]|uniref:Uncharacterized protein n=1 Tax=Canavalia gladiata TaxID=3824 RepID=A0AAN9L554_CANGL